DGSFNASLPASAGDPLTITATNGKTNGPVSLGTVPFSSSVSIIPIASPGGDGGWRARIVRVEGNNLILTSFPADGVGNSDKVVLYDVSNPATPVLKRTISTFSYILDAQVVNGWAYLAGSRFGTLDLSSNTSTVNLAADLNGNEYGLAVVGGYAFTGEVDWNNDGRINVYDVTNPAAPRFVRQSGGLIGTTHAFSDLLAYGNDYLIGLSPNGTNVDVTVIDRRNINNIFKVGQLSINNMVAFRGRIVGTKLYFGGYDGGTAIVDLTNPAAPALVTQVSTAIARGADISGSTFATANGSQGVTFYDVSANTLHQIGAQQTGGVAWDVAYGRGNLYVAVDTGLAVLANVAAPPAVDT